MAETLVYTHIKGSRYLPVITFVSGEQNLWMAGDHLLLTRIEGFSQIYKRFGFSDIQALIIERNNHYRNISLSCGLLSLFFLYMMRPVSSAGGLFAVLLGLSLVLLAVNWYQGPTCRVYIRTMVQTSLLPMKRVKAAEKVIGQLVVKIAAVQGSAWQSPPVAEAAATPETGE